MASKPFDIEKLLNPEKLIIHHKKIILVNKIINLLYIIGTPLAILFVTKEILRLVNDYGVKSLFVFGVVSISALFGLCIRWLYKDGRLRLSHFIVLWVMMSGTVIMSSTVYLAYIGSTQIAESLAATVASTMIAEAIGYALGSAAEHVTGTLAGSSGAVAVDSITSTGSTVAETVTSNVKNLMDEVKSAASAATTSSESSDTSNTDESVG